jgi:hypothetical protein
VPACRSAGVPAALVEISIESSSDLQPVGKESARFVGESPRCEVVPRVCNVVDKPAGLIFGRHNVRNLL